MKIIFRDIYYLELWLWSFSEQWSSPFEKTPCEKLQKSQRRHFYLHPEFVTKQSFLVLTKGNSLQVGLRRFYQIVPVPKKWCFLKPFHFLNSSTLFQSWIWYSFWNKSLTHKFCRVAVDRIFHKKAFLVSNCTKDAVKKKTFFSWRKFCMMHPAAM